MSKLTGPSRIPKFSSRIPVPGQILTEVPSRLPQVQLKQKCSSSVLPLVEDKVITEKDLSKKVRVDSKSGILRYVGEVHFASGVWCGIELTDSVGKNDGCIRGVRYFACPAARGLMAPLSKVELIEEGQVEEDNDAASGPYSIIFGLDKEQFAKENENNRTYLGDERSINNRKENDTEKSSHDASNEETKKSLNFRAQDRRLICNIVEKRKCSDSSCLNDTLNSDDNLVSSFNDSSYEQTVITCTTEKCHDRNEAFLKETTPNKSLKSKNDNTYVLSDETATIKKTKYSHAFLNETLTKEKQRGQSNSFVTLNDTTSNNKKCADTLEKPASYPQIRNFELLRFDNSSLTSVSVSSKFCHFSSLRDIENSPRKLRYSHINNNDNEDDASKRDSLELDESLGILTPERMADTACFVSTINSRTPSSENIGSLPNDAVVIKSKSSDLPSPNFIDFSLGILDDNVLNFTCKSDTTMNMELPLDPKSKDFTLARLDQTPSPEDLPLDPTPIVVESDNKTENTAKSKTSSFITSITSITSLDTGYQGDGEMSRPASRGADNSPMTRRPLPRPQPRRPDPMTDSDFYTESDADNHEEHPLRGDRRAQVIDGTLYGVDPQAAADLYANNRENMDSSGIFTDIETNTRTDEISSADNGRLVPTADVSPSDTSSKTISDNSQNLAIINNTTPKTEPSNNNQEKRKNVDGQPKRNVSSPSTAASSPLSVRSTRHTPKDETPAKKHKMPKRNEENKKTLVNKVKSPGRWDAVMSKITKSPSEQNKINFKDVKSKVFSSISLQNRVQNQNKNNLKPPESSSQKSPNCKLRRARVSRSAANATNNKEVKLQGSAQGSLSDLSGSSLIKNNIGSGKKRDVVRVTQVLTASKLSPKNSPQNNAINNEVKKTSNSQLQGDAKLPKRNIFSSSKEKKQISNKEGVRGTVKGGRASPGARPPMQSRAPSKPAPRTTEALAVLVQHLVFNLEAFRVPSLRREVEKAKLDTKEARLLCRQLEETLAEERIKHAAEIEEMKTNCRAEVAEIIKQHRMQIAQLNHQNSEIEQRLLEEQENLRRSLEQMKSLNLEFTKLQKSHEESLDILREENDAIREQIDEKNAVISTLQHYKLENEKLKKANAEIDKLKEQLNNRSGGDDNFNRCLQEVQSLRAVLELKQSEVQELRRALAEANERAESLSFDAEKASSLSARCDDLKLQLERKALYEQQLIAENSRLQESIKDECNQKKRLCQHNEELQWKLKQNKEVLTHVLEKAEESGAFNRSFLSASFNERHTTQKPCFERALSFRERTLSSKSSNSLQDEDHQELPSSPKIKGVVEKSDSVSYVLDLQESAEVVASRIMRRSFRNSTPPKNTPTKSPANKRPRMKNNPLSLSASASSIIPSNKSDHMRSRSVSVRNGEYETSDEADSLFIPSSTPINANGKKLTDINFASTISSMKLEDNLDLDEYNDMDIAIPTLPSEIGQKNGAQILPTPQHLAGEAMISESNSEDETSSSSVL